MIKTVAHNNYDGTWRIETSHGDFILIDEEDLDLVMRYSWCINARGYAHAHFGKKWVTLHRYLLGITDPTVTVDHINGDPLDNRRENLRVCSQAENVLNRKLGKNNTSGHAGVIKLPSGHFGAKITLSRKTIWLGTYKEFEDAVRVRKDGENKYFGDFGPHGRNARMECGMYAG